MGVRRAVYEGTQFPLFFSSERIWKAFCLPIRLTMPRYFPSFFGSPQNSAISPEINCNSELKTISGGTPGLLREVIKSMNKNQRSNISNGQRLQVLETNARRNPPNPRTLKW